MANNQKPSRAPVTGNVEQYAKRVVSSYVEGGNAVKAAENAVIGARRSALDSLKAALAGFNGKVTAKAWDQDWSPHVKAALLASGMGEKTVPVRASELKAAVMALTHGIEPGKDEKSLQGFVRNTARPGLERSGIALSNGKKGASRKRPQDTSDKAFKAACKTVAGEGASRAQIEMVAYMFRDHADVFFTWAAKKIAILSDGDDD